MNKIVLATKNRGKIKEFQQLLAQFNVEIISSYQLTNPPEVIENKNTFAGNAEKKAFAYMQYTNLPALADDSGLSVDFLNGKPGVHSARYAGEYATDKDNNNKLLLALENIPLTERTAHFTSAIALVLPSGSKHVVEGICQGLILTEQRGDNGFGYDPLFYVPELKKTYAQMSDAEKNQYSHRGLAMKKLYALIASIWH